MKYIADFNKLIAEWKITCGKYKLPLVAKSEDRVSFISIISYYFCF